MLDKGVDVFKLHGRESAMRLQESMDLIETMGSRRRVHVP